jgi:hypothetical protein
MRVEACEEKRPTRTLHLARSNIRVFPPSPRTSPALLMGSICRCWRAIKPVCCAYDRARSAQQAGRPVMDLLEKFRATERYFRAAIARGVCSLLDAALAVASRVAVKRGVLAVKQRPTNILDFRIEYAGCQWGGVGPETDCPTSACAHPASRLPQTSADFSSQDSYHLGKLPRHRARSKWQCPLLQLRAFCARCG